MDFATNDVFRLTPVAQEKGNEEKSMRTSE